MTKETFNKLCALEPWNYPWAPVLERLEYDNKIIAKGLLIKNFYNFKTETKEQKELLEFCVVRGDLDFLEEKKGIIFVGPVGCGKTHLMMGLMQSMAYFYFYTNNGLKKAFQFWSFSDLCAYLREEPNDFDRLKKIREVKYLFLDDLGIQKQTDFIQEKILNIYDYRCSSGLPTFITTNLSEDKILREYGQRMFSRMKECSDVIEIKNIPDQRGKNVLDFVKPWSKK